MILILYVFAACNPFAPGIDNDLGESSFLADQSTPDGLFENWSKSYYFRDTLIYARILHPDFRFSYRNFELNSNPTWDRETDIRKTYGLFASSQYVDLVWNEYLLSEGDSLNWNAIRQFSLQITFSDNDIVNLAGRANVQLKRDDPSEDWKLYFWQDESNY